MESYRLNSKLIENNNEYLIQTYNDVGLKSVQTEIFVNGSQTETIKMPHPEEINAEEVLSLVKSVHNEKKDEIEILLKAVSKSQDSGSSEEISNLGMAFYFRKFYLEARELFKAACLLKPDYHQSLNFLGKAELALGDIEEAINYSQKAVLLRPEFADYRNNLGEAFLASKKYKEASLEFQRAININLYYSDAYFNYGLTLLINACEKQNQDLFKDFMSRARDFLTKASLINHEYRSNTFDNGIKALDEQDIKLAFNLLKQVRENIKENQRKKSAPYYMKYIVNPNWVTEKAIQERILFLKSEVEKNPTYVDLYSELAKCYMVQSKLFWEKGIEHYTKTSNLNSSLDDIDEYISKATKVMADMSEVVNFIEEKN